MRASPPRRQVVLLAALLVGLALVVAYQYSGTSQPNAGNARSPRPAGPGAAAGQGALPEVPALKLADLSAARPEPAGAGRNLFREKPAAPPPPVSMRRPAPVAPDPNAPPPPPPPPPPIPLKFIGLVEARGGKIAVLSSEAKDVFYGREGDVIEGRYKIIRIGVESIEMSYVDGRGRQRIPLTG
jgi:hypothetical protein